MRVFCLILFATTLYGQTASKLTLAQAEAIALKNHPRVSAARLTAAAASQVTIEVRSSLYPTMSGSVTGAGALDNSRLTAGALNNPVIFNRLGAGVTISQLVTDFGRTGHLVESSRLRARAQDEEVQSTRADVLLQVDRAYFSALRAAALLQVAEQAVSSRQLIVEQVSALAQSRLRSELDLSFAKVNLADARLLAIRARNERDSAFADLAAAMGLAQAEPYELAEEPLPAELPPNVIPLIQEALVRRPELTGIRLEEEAAQRFASAEKGLRNPTISALASAGGTPAHDDRLTGRYAAAGVSVNIPILNGHLFSARHTEAELRSQAIAQRRKQLENLVTRDVRVAWLNAGTAYQRLDASRQLREQAALSLELAQARYDLGLSSIVELSQAQLNKTSAEIADAAARYDYQIQRAALNYETGRLP